jgi:hypothetical protein
MNDKKAKSSSRCRKDPYVISMSRVTVTRLNNAVIHTTMWLTSTHSNPSLYPTPDGGERIDSSPGLSGETSVRLPEQEFRKQGWGFWQSWKETALGLLLLLTSILAIVPQKVHADGVGMPSPNVPGGFSGGGIVLVGGIRAAQTVYAYVGTGEKLRFDVRKMRLSSAVQPTGASDMQIRVYNAAGTLIGGVQTIDGTVAEGYSANNIATPYVATAATAGIWRVDLTPLDETIMWGYDIDVLTAAGAEKPGRVYTENLSLAGNSTGFTPNGATFNLFHINNYGYEYTSWFFGYLGVDSAIWTDRSGVSQATGCISAYRSAEMSDATVRRSSCDGRFKQFFKAIDQTMPTTARLMGVAGEWLNPAIVTPTVTGLVFTKTAGNPAQGSFGFTVAGYAGNATLQIDANNDGDYVDAVDRNIAIDVPGGPNPELFDPKHGQGAFIGCSQIFRARILISKPGEIHFTMLDVEGLGGIRVTASNGAGSSILYWDDTKLSTAGRLTTPITNGTAGRPSNVANGVHGWAYNTSIGWGETRLIDNWTFTAAAIGSNTVSVTVPKPTVTTPANVVICNGGTARFVSTVANANTYKWQFSTNGTTWSPVANGVVTGVTTTGATSATLTMTPVPTSYTGRRYRILASHTASPTTCTATSAGALLTVTADPAVTVNPTSKTLCVGGNATMVASVTGGTGTASFIWQRRVTSASSWTNIAATTDGGKYGGFTTATLSLTNVTAAMNGYEYRRYTAYSGSGCGPVYTAVARLTVVADPVISDQPDSQTVCSSGTAIFSAQATGGVGGLTYRWQQSVDAGVNWSPLSDAGSVSGALTNTLTLTAVTTTWNARRYRVVVTSSASGTAVGCTPTVTSSQAILTVSSGGPTLSGPLSQSVCEGGTARFVVNVTGLTGVPTYQWQQLNVGTTVWVPRGNAGTITGATTATLTVGSALASWDGIKFRVIVSDNAACDPTSVVATLTVNANTEVHIDPQSSTICAGTSDTLQAVVDGGAGTMSYLWAIGTTPTGPFTPTGITSSSLVTTTSLLSGTYYYKVTVTPTGSGCSSATAVAAVTVNASPTASILSGGGTICPDGTSNIQVLITGGAAPYTVKYLEGTTLQTEDEYTSGNLIVVAPPSTTVYKLVSVTDTNGCASPVSGSATVTVAGGITSAALVGGGTVCAGSSSTIAVNIVGGVSPYSLTYTDGTSEFTRTSYSSNGPISVTVGSGDTFFQLVNLMDAAGCVAPVNDGTADFTVLESGFANDTTLVACDNDGDGVSLFNLTSASTVILNGITGTVSYFRDEQLTQAITTAQASSYSSTASTVYARVVRSPQGCIDTARVFLEMSSLQVGAEIVDSVCVGKPFQLTASSGGGTGNATFSWNGPNGFNSTQASPVISTSATTAMSGNYIVVVTDEMGCMARDTLAINVLPCCTLIAIANVPETVTACGGSPLSFSVTVTGAQGTPTYAWRGPNNYLGTSAVVSIPVATTANSGQYIFTVTDGVGCIKTDTVDVIISPTLSVSASISSLTTCSGDEVAINYTTESGQQVVWVRRSAVDAPETGAGNVLEYPTATGTTPVSYTYTAFIPTLSDCISATAVTVVQVNPRPIVTPSTCAQTICSGQTGIITFVPSIANSTIHWTRTPTIPAPSSGTGNIGEALTNTGPTSVTYTYSIWAISPAPGLCSSSDTITCIIVVTPGLSVSAMVASGGGCIGQPLSLSATVPVGTPPPVNFIWTGPNSFMQTGNQVLVTNAASITDNGSYTVTATGASGCSGTATVAVSVSNCCSLTANAGNPITVCTGSDLNLTVTAGNSTTAPVVGQLQYRWSGPNNFTADIANPTLASVSATASGIYSVTVTDGQNCTAVSNVTVTVRPVPSADAVSNSPVCSGGTLQLSATGGVSYKWYGPNGYSSTGQTVQIPGVTSVNAGNYTVVVTDANGCTATAIEPVTIPGPEVCDPNCPNPTLTYGGPYCTDGIGVPTFSPQGEGFVGGFAASPVGLVINPATGELNLNASAPGTYIVTYTVQNTATGCIGQVQAFVTVLESPKGNGITTGGN